MKVRQIFAHTPDAVNGVSLSGKINEFHIGVVASRLSESTLTVEQKVYIINEISINLHKLID